MVVKGGTENPFEARDNQRQKHPALNRKLPGASRNVGLARTKAVQRREQDLRQQFLGRRNVSQVLDKRFGEQDASLTREEKMLKRFQKVRSKRKAGRFHLGEGDDEGLTHLGQSLSAALDEQVDQAEEEDEEEMQAGEDVTSLIRRLQQGETAAQVLDDKAPTKKLTKKEALADVIRKSKILKMERQREKEADYDEVDRVDALMRTALQSGELTLVAPKDLKQRPTDEPNVKPKTTDDYEKMVRDLQLDPKPKAQASDRIKTPEELASDEKRRLEELERKRVERMEKGFSDDDDDDEEEDDRRSKRQRKRAKKLNQGQEEEEEEEEHAEDDGLPFLIECPSNIREFVEFRGTYHHVPLDTILDRIRKTNSVHLGAENRQKLNKLIEILIEYQSIAAEQACQLRDDEEKQQDVLSCTNQLYALCLHLSSRETATFFANRLDLIRRTFESHLGAALKMQGMGGDYGKDKMEQGKPMVERKAPGGHKDGLSSELNAQLAAMASLRKDDKLVTSPLRCWPSSGDFAFLSSLRFIFSASDQRHPIVTAASLLLGRMLSDAPIRGPWDVLAALQCAVILDQYSSRREDAASGIGNNRFAPEVMTLTRVFLSQASNEQDVEPESTPTTLVELDRPDGTRHSAFDFLRQAPTKPPKKRKGAHQATLNGLFSYSLNLESGMAAPLYETVCDILMDLILGGCRDLQGNPSADEYLGVVKQALEYCPNDHFRNRMEAKQVRQVVETSLSECHKVPLKLQEFAPESTSLAPSFLENSKTASQSTHASRDRVLQKKRNRERKGVGRELRLDSQYLAEARRKEKNQQLSALRAKRHSNFQEVRDLQAGFNKAVKSGVKVEGAGVGGLNLKGRRMGKISSM